ncbi:MAG: hypothetical protein AAF493_05735 [Pseudomonadota bacterium]
MTATRTEGIVLVLILGAAFAVYAPGLSGPFVFDDFTNIVHNYFLRIDSLNWEEVRDAALSSRSGPLGRPIAMLSFALNYLASGEMSAFAVKLTNVVIHLTNTFLVYLLVRRWTCLRWGEPVTSRVVLVAGAAAALWALHPLQLTNVLYAVQRMNALSVLFCLIGLLIFTHGRAVIATRPLRGFSLMGIGLGGGVVLGVATKENAAVLPLLVVLIEWWMFDAASLPRNLRRALLSFYTLFVVVPIALGIGLLSLRPDIITKAYEARDFSMIERVLTQFRVLFFYLFLLVYPNVRHFSLFHDDFPVSHGLTDPISTLIAGAVWLALLGLVLMRWRRRPVWAFAIVWYLAAHGVESSIIGLELVFEHRNYLPTVGVMFAGCFYLAEGLVRLRVRLPAIAVIATVVAVAFGMSTFARASIWSNSETLSYFLARNNPDGIRAQKTRAYKELRNGVETDAAYQRFSEIAQLDLRTVDPLVEMIKILVAEQRHGGGETGGSEHTNPAASWRDARPTTPPARDAMMGAIDQEIHRRLRENAITGDTLGGLRKAQECVRAGWDVCLPLIALVSAWHETAMENTRISKLVRARVRYSAALLAFYRHEGRTAVSLMRDAMADDPGDISFALQLTHLHILLGELEAADDILSDLESRVGDGEFRSREVVAMRHQLIEARGAAEKANTVH